MRNRWLPVLAGAALVLAAGAVVAPATKSAAVVHVTAAGDFGAQPATGSVLAKIKELNPDAHLALGDLAYGDLTPESSWCDYVKQRLGEGFAFQLVSGNHESHDLKQGYINNYSACLPNQIPGVVGTYGREYYMDLPKPSPMVRMIQASPTLTFEDGKWNYQAGDAHYAWLVKAIDDARAAGIKWVIVSAHVPCLSLGIRSCPQPDDFYDLLVAKKVDLVLHGHEHAYMRTHQLRSGVPGCTALDTSSSNSDCIADSDSAFTAGVGTVFATVGTGGVALGNLDLASPRKGYFASWSGLNANPTHGVLDMSITAERLTASFVAADGGNHADSFSIDRSVSPPDFPPTASFETTTNGLSVSTDASRSIDVEGPISNYNWDFGDGSTATGVKATHRFAAAGTYPITLIVTDSAGSNGSLVQQVTVSTQVALPVTLSLPAVQDSYVRSDQTSANFGSLNQVYARGTNPVFVSYFAFDLPSAPAGTQLAGATLRLRTTTSTSAGSVAAHQVSLASGAWSEGQVTWANRPIVAGQVGSLPASSQMNTQYDITLDATQLAALLGGRSTLAVSTGTTSSDTLLLWSREYSVASYRPALTLRFEPSQPATVAAFVGDSYTAGTGASSPAKRWSSLVASSRGWSERNYGSGGTGYLTSAGPSGCGQPFCPEYGGRLPDLVADQPDVVLIAGGQNDLTAFQADPSAGAAKIATTYADARRLFPEATIVAVGPSSPSGPTSAFTALDRAVRDGAAGVGATYVSLLDPPVITPSMLLPDQVHVGDEGHQAIADRVRAGLSASPSP